MVSEVERGGLPGFRVHGGKSGLSQKLREER
jgi:hypothetical protein